MNILLLCHFTKNDAQTVIDHATSFDKYSKHTTHSLDPCGRSLPNWLNLSLYDIIIIHYSLYTISEYYLHKSWVTALSSADACKVMFIQDEYRRVDDFIAMMKKIRINILYTCVPEEEIEKVYPEAKLPGVRKINTLTGYVPEILPSKNEIFQAKRPIDVGYRSRDIGFRYGDLGREKIKIASEFNRNAQKHQLACNISCLEKDRIYGKGWVEFLLSCKCTLGTESGSNIFDFSGKLEEDVAAFLAINPTASYQTVRNKFLNGKENKIRMNQVSPRIFESIAYGACLILFEGEYSGVVLPYRHYLPLKKDFSNIEQVVENIKDKHLLAKITKTAYADIIESGRYSFRQFICSFDQALCEYFSEANDHSFGKMDTPKNVLDAANMVKKGGVGDDLIFLKYKMGFLTNFFLINILRFLRDGFVAIGISIRQHAYSLIKFFKINLNIIRQLILSIGKSMNNMFVGVRSIYTQIYGATNHPFLRDNLKKAYKFNKTGN